jgi:hypothetical protein
MLLGKIDNEKAPSPSIIIGPVGSVWKIFSKLMIQNEKGREKPGPLI